MMKNVGLFTLCNMHIMQVSDHLKKYLEDNKKKVIVLDVLKKSKYNVEINNILDYKASDFDELYIVAGDINFIGGTIQSSIYPKIRLLNEFKNKEKIFYYISDPLFPLKDYGSLIKNALYERRKCLNDDGKYEKLTKDECDLFSKTFKKCTVLFTGRDYKKFENNLKSTHKNLFKGNKFINEPMLFSSFFKDAYNTIVNNSIIEYDYLYYGYHYKSNRIQLLKKILDHNESKLTGAIVGQNPEFVNSKVNCFVEKNGVGLMYIAKKSICSIIIGDSDHSNNWITFRLYESLIFNTVNMIYINFDENKEIFGCDVELKELSYFSNLKELESNINKLRNKDTRDRIINKQKEILFK